MTAATELAEALSSGRRHGIDVAIERACAEGALKLCGDAWVSPQDDDESWSAIPVCSSWRHAGFLPFHAKRYEALGSDADILTALSGAIATVPQLQAPPLWIGETWLVTLHLPGSINLASMLEEGGETTRIIRHCLNSLETFADRESLFQAAIADAGCRPPSTFPLTERYNAACDRLKHFYDAAVLRDLPDLAPSKTPSGPVALLCDPKPANFIRPQSDEASRIYRVDLDLMTFSTPLSLQAAIAAFSVPSEPAGSRQETFALRLAQWKAWCTRCAAGPEDEHLRHLLYHLIRNLASSQDQRNAHKAQAMSDMLVQLIDLEPSLRSLQSFRDVLARTLMGGVVEEPQ